MKKYTSLNAVRRTAKKGLCALVLTSWVVGCAEPAAEPPKPAHIPVTTEAVASTSFQAGIGLLGRLAPSSQVDIVPPATGRILYASGFPDGLRSGRDVRKGQLLFKIENPALELRLTEAQLAMKAAETDLARAKAGVDAGIMPRAELEAQEIAEALAGRRLESAQQELDRLAYRSPASGVLQVDRHYLEGTEVATGTVLASLSGSGARRIEAWVSAADLERLTPGLQVECRRPRRTRLLATARLVEVAQEVEAGGVAKVVAEVEQDMGLPRIGEGLDLLVLMPPRDNVLTVPERALIINGHVKRVFVLEPAGAQLRADSRLVRVGGRFDGRVEIVEGLSDGELVAVEGAEYLTDGMIAEDVTEPAAAGSSPAAEGSE